MRIYANENFKAIRMKQGFSLVDLGKAVNLSKSAIGQLERRVNGISPRKSREILTVLGLEFDDVFELIDFSGE